jgi:cation-transporting P-type ATPase F
MGKIDLNKQWHALTEESALDFLQTKLETGLSQSEVEDRQTHYGKNVITQKSQRSALMRFLLQFHQSLVYILLGAIVISFFLGEYVDALVIFAVVLANAIVGYLQESKAIKAIEALAESMVTETTVLRDGEKARINANLLVPGDVVELSAGDKVPADMRVIKQRDLRIDESALTGESLPADKSNDPLEAQTVLADRTNMAYASTVVTYGRATGVVTHIGDWTEVGKISSSISNVTEIDTPLTQKINKFSKLLLFAILGLSFITFIIGMLRHADVGDVLMAAIALAVAAIPEGLPAAVTIMLAIGVSRMAKKRAIIRKLVAVETLGSTTVICSDKTGTLTENQMTVQAIFAQGNIYKVSGIGYEPVGEIVLQEKPVLLGDHHGLRECLVAGMLCNDSQLTKENQRWAIQGDPTEGALLVAAIKAGLEKSGLKKDLPQLDVIPFESEYQYMATLHETQDHSIVYIKGSMEALLHRGQFMQDQNGAIVDLDKERFKKEVDALAAMGLRVLALGKKELPKAQKVIGHRDIESGLVLLGLQGMIDPPRKEAVEAVKKCQEAGISVKMITGDHSLTAATIAGQIGLKGKMKDERLVAVTGQELATYDDEKLKEVALDSAVFARVAPEQKLRLVKALQAKGHVTAMTGDGVNDGPALKQADIGIAMGISGTDVAKDASDMVLTDDNFSSIEKAVEEGRCVFDNLTKYIVWILPTNLGQGLVILISFLLGSVIAVSPVQILWVNMTTALLLGLMLTFEPKEPDIMVRPPRNPNMPILTYPLIMRTLLVGFILMITAYGLFAYELSIGSTIEKAQTVAVTVIIVLQTFYLFNCRSLTKSLFSIGFFSNPWIFLGVLGMMVLQLAFIYLEPMNLVFHSEPIGLDSWLWIVIAGIVLFAIISFEKWVRR